MELEPLSPTVSIIQYYTCEDPCKRARHATRSPLRHQLSEDWALKKVLSMWSAIGERLDGSLRSLHHQLLQRCYAKTVAASVHINYVPCRSTSTSICGKRAGSQRPLSFTSSPSLILANPRRAAQRLSLISRHLEQRPQLKINTPYSTERISQAPDDLPYTPLIRPTPDISKIQEQQKREFATMSTQAPHPSLLIPGPIEFDDAVLQSMSHYRYLANYCCSFYGV